VRSLGERLRTIALSSAALVGFAANSILCRLALSPRAVDAATFTSLRLGAGALTLALLARATGRPGGSGSGGSWWPAMALFTYAAAFSYAYLQLTAGTGALVLFGSVQATMIGGGLMRGERLHRIEWVGLAAAFAGLVALTFPGLAAPRPSAIGLMALAGAAWGLYSIAGRGVSKPLAATATNFARSVPFAVGASLATGLHAHASTRGILLAVASGSLASGVGYALWFAALPGLTSARAAIVQLGVPVLAGAGGVILLGEPITPRLLVASVVILGGVAVASMRPRSS
jgi:drug/metabolite transporter (DMT)-like permease